MRGPENKASPGDPVFRGIKAARWNDAMDAGRAYRESRLDGGVGEFGPPFPVSGIILVKNSSASPLPSFSIQKLGAAVVLPTDFLPTFQDWIAMSGSTPGASSDKFCITLQALDGGEMGKACVSGPCLALVDITDAAHTHAAPIAGDVGKLASGTTGASILFKDGGTGQKWCYVLLGLTSTTVIPTGATTVAFTDDVDTGGSPIGATYPGKLMSNGVTLGDDIRIYAPGLRVETFPGMFVANGSKPPYIGSPTGLTDVDTGLPIYVVEEQTLLAGGGDVPGSSDLVMWPVRSIEFVTAGDSGITVSHSGGRLNAWVHDASATLAGKVSTGTQTFAGNKTFTGTVSIGNGITQVVDLAKLTPGGTNGSLTITNGVPTAYTAPT